MFSSLLSAGVKVGRCLTVCVQEAKSRALLRTQLDAVGWPLRGQELPDQLNLPVLQHRHASSTTVKLVAVAMFSTAQTGDQALWLHIPASRSRPRPFVYDGSPRPLGCVRVSVWPPALPSPSLLWSALFCKSPVPPGSSATCGGSRQSFGPSGWSLGWGGAVQRSRDCQMGMNFYWQWASIKRRTINYLLGSMFSLRRSTCVHSLSYRFWRCATVLSMFCFVLWDSVRGTMCALRQQQKQFKMPKSPQFTDQGKHS